MLTGTDVEEKGFETGKRWGSEEPRVVTKADC